MKKKNCLTALLAVFCATVMYAQDTLVGITNLNQIVVTGTGNIRKLKNSPVPIDVITSKAIRESGVVTFENVMSRLNPSFIFTSNSMSDKTSMDGLESKYLLILIDGKKVTGDISGSVDLSRLNMSNVRQIEVLKGAASSLYGSDAISGVINIITDQSKMPLDISSTTRVGSFSQFMQSVNIEANKGKIGTYTSYRRLQSNGWQLSDKEISVDKKTGKEKLIPTDKQAVNAFYSNIISQKISYTPTNKLSIYAQGSFYDKIGRRPISAYAYDMSYKDFNYGIGAKLLTRNDGYISIDLYSDNYEYYKNYTKESGSFLKGDSERQKRQSFYSSNLKSVFNIGDFNKATVGVEYINENLCTESLKSGNESVYTASVYIQDEVKLPLGLQIVAGGRLVYHQTFKSRFTPKVSLMYSIGKINIRGTYSQGFRAPSLLELYYDYESRGSLSKGNIDLKPEKSNYGSINLEYGSKCFYTSLSIYANELSDMINRIQIPVTEQEKLQGISKSYRYDNISKALVKGVNLSLTCNILQNIRFGVGYSFNDAKDLDKHVQISGSAKHSANVNMNWKKDWTKYGLNLNISGTLQGKRFYLNEDNAVSHQVWNITSTHSFRPIRKIIFEPSFGIENLFNFIDNKPYGSNYSTLSPGRTVFASLVIKFSK